MNARLPLPPCIIDVEASGFGAGSYPIEVGAALSDGGAYCSLIHPEPDWRHWAPSAESVHGITRDTLAAHGKAAAVVAADLNRHLSGTTVYTDAWYHDYQWLARLFDAANLPQQFQLQDLRQLLSPAAMARWDDTKAQVMQEMNLTRHRASNDAKVLQHTLLRVMELEAFTATAIRHRAGCTGQNAS
ncbi:MAG: hypothetical protein ACOVO0_01715 [Burkholderiaceae bacterium]